jgi:hypothetical protein
MTKTTLDWTHKNLNIIDIRKVNKLYVIIINAVLHSELTNIPLFVSEKIFEERLKSYFLKDVSKITREEILNVEWNMYITKGYYIKVSFDGSASKFEHDINKWYVSYLEIAGPLGTFLSVYNIEKE